MMLGLLGALGGFFISYYTCMLIIRMAGNDSDYCETLRKFYGTKGYYTGLIAPAILITGGVIVYFVIMSQVLYPNMLAIYAWSSG